MATLTQAELNHNNHHPSIVHLGKNLIKSEHDNNSMSHTNKSSSKCLQEIDTSSPTSEENNSEEPPVIDIVINNVVCSFNVRCHLNLREIALSAINVEYRRENGMLTMKIRSPYTTASFWSSGKVTCTGATSEELAKKAARRFTRILQKLGFRVRFTNFRVVNVLGTCSMPFGIKITHFSEHHRPIASYEPELHPGVTYKIKDLRATLKIFSTGSITITAPSVANVQGAVEHIFPLVYEFRKELTPAHKEMLKQRKLKNARNRMSSHNKAHQQTAHNKAASESSAEEGEGDSDQENLCIDSDEEQEKFWDK